MTFARDTHVSVDRSKAEIEQLLRRYGADQFFTGWDADAAVIGFRAQGRFVKFHLPLPSRTDAKFTRTPSRGTRRTSSEADRHWEQACRQRWRALALVIKAKLEAVASGITTFEDEFLAHVVMPDGQSVGDWVRPQVEDAYLSGKMPPLLPSHDGGR
jgi:hypothetical protein